MTRSNTFLTDHVDDANRVPVDADASGDRSPHGVAQRSEVVTWESAAWTLVGIAWAASAWPGLLVSWDGVVIVPVVAVTALAVFVMWQVMRGAPWSRPSCWVAARTRRVARTPRSRRTLAIAIAIDGVLWAASGVAWCAAARRYNWSEGFTGAAIQMGVGLAFILWAAIGFLAARRIADSGDDTVVVSRRILGAGPMTVVDSSTSATRRRTTGA